ncbi:MAG: hypothetical protein R3B74_12345 [Nitrospirales bacterium]|nr:hypothetical protein [Nitrospirales bacterium]
MELVQPGWSNGAMTEFEPGSEKALSQRVMEAELIFSGTVEKLEYSLSQGTADSQGALPYTYVTYRINHIMKGRSTNRDRLTLRFLGGRTPDGRYLEASNMPQFEVNDRDLLFVVNNGGTDCPLVGCQSGRFRVVKKGVYADDGRPVVGINKGHFLYDNQVNSSSAPLTLERVKEAIMEEVARLYSPQELQAFKPVQSAEPGMPASLPTPQDESPPNVMTPSKMGTDAIKEEDRLESEALKHNQGNPVLKKNPSR